MNGRVLSEEEINEKEQELVAWFSGASDTSHHRAVVIAMNALATIRDRDKTIAELKRYVSKSNYDSEQTAIRNVVLQQQNTLMLSALERIATYNDGADALEDLEGCQDIAHDTIAQVKAPTVSKQEESTVSEVACEQTTKDSLHVARQNNPTHPTKHMSKLAAEVASDMRWREGEQK